MLFIICEHFFCRQQGVIFGINHIIKIGWSVYYRSIMYIILKLYPALSLNAIALQGKSFLTKKY